MKLPTEKSWLPERAQDFQNFVTESIVANACGTALLLIALSTLSFLWHTGDGNKNWRTVMLNGLVRLSPSQQLKYVLHFQFEL